MTKWGLEDKRTAWIVSGLILILFLITNLPWELDDYDQAKQAYTSFQMVKEGHWFYQQTPHERIATKPPLVGWISSGIFVITRSWDVAWRIPSLLAAVAISILLFRVASSAYGSMAGLIAFSAFGLNLLSPRIATLARTDMPLTLGIFLIGLQVWTHIRERRSWNKHDRWVLFLLLAATLLIKGPIVYAFLLPGILFFQWRTLGGTRIIVSQIFGRARRGPTPAWSIRCGWWPWFGSLAIFLGWVIGGIILQAGFFDQVVIREFVGRFGESIHRPQPIYFYWPHLLHKFAPWSLFMIGLAIIAFRRQRKSDGIKPSSSPAADRRKISPETLWLIGWSLGGLITMSLIPSKRVDRIYPVIPPLCLLLAVQVANALRNEHARKAVYAWSAITLVLSMLFTSVYSGARVTNAYRHHKNALVVFGNAVRAEAEKHRWRYGVVRAKDEGLLLYLRKLHFLQPERAVADWNRDDVDALVVPVPEVPIILRQIHDAALSELRSEPRMNDQDPGYVLITR